MTTRPDQREFTRVPVSVKVELATRDGVFFTQKTRNLSMKGLYMEASDKLPVNTECQLRLFLGESKDAACIEILGRISRVDEMGMAIEFKQIEVEGFERLRDLVLLNTNQVQEVEEEFRSHLGLRKPH